MKQWEDKFKERLEGFEMKLPVSDRDAFLNQCRTNIGEELKKLGLDLININISDIKDSADYIGLGVNSTTSLSVSIIILQG